MVQSQPSTGAASSSSGGASAGLSSQSTARSLRTEPSSTTTTTSGSQTQTTHDEAALQTEPILRLRGEHAPRGRGGPRVQWAEGVVDNEGMGKKSSKGVCSFLFWLSWSPKLICPKKIVCCIYHAPKAVGESSDESDSSSSSSSSSSDDSDSDAGQGSSRRAMDSDRVGKSGRRGRRGRDGDVKRTRKPSPNAYEKVPKPKPRRDNGGGGGGGGLVS